MGTLLLRLAAPLQSWGVDSKFDTRQTGREPSKSGVIGLLAAALGVRRDDEAALERLSALRFGVRVEQEGELLHDFHMARKDKKTSYLTHRYYLADAVFLAAVYSEDDALLAELDEALRHPAFPLFLGRRSCPPTLPISLGLRAAGLKEALESEPWHASPWAMRRATQPRLRIMTDAADPVAARKRAKDVPVSFSPYRRLYAYRAVSDGGFVEPPALAQTEHDAMQELR